MEMGYEATQWCHAHFSRFVHGTAVIIIDKVIILILMSYALSRKIVLYSLQINLEYFGKQMVRQNDLN